MRVHDFVNEGLGHSSYLIDLCDGTAAVIDPPRFPSAHERAARSSRLRVAWPLDTPPHADSVRGTPALAARTDAVFVAPAASRLATPHRPVADGDTVTLADSVSLQ